MDHRKLDVTVKIGREGSVPYRRAIYLTAMSETEPAGSPSPEPPFVTDPTSGTKRKMTPDELQEWEAEVRARGREWANANIELCLAQARSIGNI